MSYATAAQIRAKIPTIASSNAIPSDATIEAIRDDVEAMIDSCLSARYALPFTATIPILRYISCILSARDIIFTQYSQDGQNVNKYIDSRVITKVEDMLKKICEGTMPLIDDSGNAISLDGNPIEGTYDKNSTTFDMDDIENSEVPGTLLEDIADEREADV